VLGETLRQRREQRGLELEDAAAALGVPAKDLRALEWDRADLLGSPGEADHLHLRYAAFLGLAVEGLTSATGTAAEAPVAAPAPAPEPKAKRRSLLVPLLAVLAPAVLIGVLVVLGESAGESAREVDSEPRASSIVTTPEPDVTITTITSNEAAPDPAPPERRVNLVVTADGGESWVEARADSASGPVLHQGTLASGRELRLTARRIWLRLGAASNVSLAVNGRSTPREFFGTVDVLVTAQGIRPAG
jgi:cytoskeleton protein RodZ